MPSRLSYVWLSLRRGLGSRAAAEALRAFGSPDALYAADRKMLATAPCGLCKAQVDALCDKDTAEAERIIGECAERGIQIITAGDSAYPDRLRAIADPPMADGRILTLRPASTWSARGKRPRMACRLRKASARRWRAQDLSRSVGWRWETMERRTAARSAQAG